MPFPTARSTTICEKCEGKLKNAPLIGLPILLALQHNAKENAYTDGKVIDPLSGNTYQGKGQLNARGNVRHFEGMSERRSLAGRVSWIRVN